MAAAATGMFVAVALSPPDLKYDECYHFPTAQAFAGRQSLHEFLTTPRESAPGPLYSVLHTSLSTATGFAIVPHRAANAILLVATMAIQAWYLRQAGPIGAAAVVGMYLAVPVVWPIGVMALTEVPAMFCATLALALLEAVSEHAGPAGQVGGYGLSGFAAGAAILGRQTYLPLVVMPVALGRLSRGWAVRTAAFLAAALALPLAVFATWRGLVPPGTEHAGGGVSPLHGMLGFAYLAVFMAIIAPRWFARFWRQGLAAAGVAAAAALAVGFEWRPLDQVSQRLPGWLQPVYPRLVGPPLVGLTAWFLVSCACNGWARRDDRRFIGCLVLTVLVAGTSFGVVHLFSSRYVVIALPFMFVIAAPYFRTSWFACGRLAAGAVVGVLSMLTYVYR